jgi:predicted ATP-grasp superfamily ATP-dependent carboligase
LNQKLFIEGVQKKAKQILDRTGEKPVVFCFSDATMNAIVDNYALLKEVVSVPLPPLESLLIARNKKKTQALAETLSIPTIPTYAQNEMECITFPAVVKNQESIVWKDGRVTSGSATFVFDANELNRAFVTIESETGQSPLVQEFVRGVEYGVEMVCEKGEVLASFVHKRVRSLSPRGGAAVVKETAQDSPQVRLMQQHARTLVEKLAWTGPVMVEFKVDSRDGTVRLMEINGRFWGSLPLAIQAGVDFPLIIYTLAHGEKVEKAPVTFSPLKIRTRHFLGDLKWVFLVLFSRDRMRPYLYPSRIRAVFDFKKELFISKGDVFDVRDLKPSFFEYLAILMK